MAERRSALAQVSSPGPASPAVTLTEVRPGCILQAAAWPDTLATVEAAIADRLGVPAPVPGRAHSDPNLTIAAVSRGRFVICGTAPDLAGRLAAALPASAGTVTDLGHGRVILRIEGEAVALLGCCVALDLDLSVFPPGRVAPTMIHHIDVLLHRQSHKSFDVWVLRSFAEALAEWLLDAGLELGVAFERK
jgi:sarcosine oxidase subunit gamma